MFNRYWVAAIALGVAVHTVPLYAQEGAQPALQGEPKAPGQNGSGAAPSTEQPTPEDRSATELLTGIEGIEAAIRELITEGDKVASEQQRDRDDADLRAQQSMAVWAFWMFIASGLGVLLTGVGVYLIWRTLIYTRDAASHAGEAVVEAKSATKAAQDAVDVTREIGEAQVRAYLLCRSARYRINKGGLSATLELANAGQSPASDVAIIGTAHVHSVGGRPSLPRVLSWANSQETTARCQPISSGGSIKDEIWFSLDYDFATNFEEGREEIELATFKNGNEIGFDLQVQWKDVFGKTFSFPVSLYAVIDASPYNPTKKRAPVGRLDFRMEDARVRVERENDENY